MIKLTLKKITFKQLYLKPLTLNKLTQQPARLLTSLLLTAILSACGGSDTTTETIPDPKTPTTPTTPTNTIEEEFALWLTDLANNHILPSYQNLQDTSALLSRQAADFCVQQNQSADDLANLKQSWRDVMTSWQSIQWLKVGPILDDNRIFRLHYWPDSKGSVEQGIEKLLTTSEVINESYIATRSVGSQGLPALEQLLFSSNPDSLIVASDKAKRCAVLTAISANVATISEQVNSEWEISQGNYHAQLTQGSGDFTGHKDAVEELVTNWLEQIERVKDEKMLVPLASVSPGNPAIAEHVFSGQSVKSIQQNIATFNVIYTAGGGHGFNNILIDHLSQQNIATEMLAAIEQAITSANVLTDDYEALLKSPEGRAQITTSIDSLRAIRDVLTVDFVQATDINIGFNSNDGD